MEVLLSAYAQHSFMLASCWQDFQPNSQFFFFFFQQWQLTGGKRPRSRETYSYNEILDLLPQVKDKRSDPEASHAKNAAQSGDVDKSTRWTIF